MLTRPVAVSACRMSSGRITCSRPAKSIQDPARLIGRERALSSWHASRGLLVASVLSKPKVTGGCDSPLNDILALGAIQTEENRPLSTAAKIGFLGGPVGFLVGARIGGDLSLRTPGERAWLITSPARGLMVRRQSRSRKAFENKRAQYIGVGRSAPNQEQLAKIFKAAVDEGIGKVASELQGGEANDLRKKIDTQGGNSGAILGVLGREKGLAELTEAAGKFDGVTNSLGSLDTRINAAAVAFQSITDEVNRLAKLSKGRTGFRGARLQASPTKDLSLLKLFDITKNAVEFRTGRIGLPAEGHGHDSGDVKSRRVHHTCICC